MPPSAISNLPRRSATAPVNAPLHVAEQLALDQLLGNRGAVHLDERAGAPPAQRVDACARPAPCRCRSRRRSARGRWSAPPSRPARAAAPSRSSRRPSSGGDRRARAARGSPPRAGAGAARCATTSTVFSSDSGFSTKSKAPILMARTADSMLPWPEIITTGASTLPLAQPRERRQAVHARQPDVEDDDVVRRARRRDRGRLRRSSTASTA